MQHRQETGVVTVRLATPYPVGDVNVYFLDDDEAPVLVDTGVFSEKSLAALDERLRERGRGLGQVRRILLTHYHYDHGGAALHLSRELGAVLYVHERSGLLDRQTPETSERLLAFLLRCGAREETLRKAFDLYRKGERFAGRDAAPRAVERLAGGETIRVGGRELEAVATPGHSHDHLCYLDAAAGTIFCGDMLLPHITPNPLLSLDPLDGWRRRRSLLDYLGSLERLAALPARRGLPGHGVVIEDVPSLVAHNLAFIEDRKRVFLEKVEGGIALPGEIARAVFGDLDPMNQYLGLSETIAYLDLLERDGLARVAWEGDPVTARPAETPAST